jgi:hypothetical protein
MQFDHRAGKYLQRIKRRERCEGVGGRVDDDARPIVDRLVHSLDELRLAVGLAKLDLPIAGLGAAHLLYVGERRRALDVRLARAETIEVRTVEYVDGFCHRFSLSCRYR